MEAPDIDIAAARPVLVFRHTGLVSLLVGAAICALPGVASAQTEGPKGPDTAGTAERPIGVELALGTWFPLAVGVDGAVEVPYGLTAHLGLGWMPRIYRDSINNTLVSFGAYSDTEGELVAAAFEDAMVLSPTFGWRPPPVPGLEIFGGYVLSFLGGTVTRAEAEDLSGQNLDVTGITQVPLSGTASAFQLGVAYQAELQRHLALRFSLAYLQVFASHISIDVPSSNVVEREAVGLVETGLNDYLHDLVTKYVKSPLFGAAIVWRF